MKNQKPIPPSERTEAYFNRRKLGPSQTVVVYTIADSDRHQFQELEMFSVTPGAVLVSATWITDACGINRPEIFTHADIKWFKGHRGEIDDWFLNNNELKSAYLLKLARAMKRYIKKKSS